MTSARPPQSRDTAAPVDADDPVRREFSPAYYVAAYPDVAESGEDPFDHYMRTGWRERRSPNAWFSPAEYLAANPDLVQIVGDLFRHYLTAGRAEGRPLHPGAGAGESFSVDELDRIRAAFDPAFYAADNPDVAAAGGDLLGHYMAWGWREGRNPTPRFNTAEYLHLNPDVRAAGANPFAHYVLHGRAEGRAFRHGLGFRYGMLQAAQGLEERIRRGRAPAAARATSSRTLVRTLQAVAADAPLHLTISHDDYTAVPGGVQLCIRREVDAMRQAGGVSLHLAPAVTGPVVDVETASPQMLVIVNGKRVGVLSTAALAGAIQDWVGDRPVSFSIHSLIGHVVEAVLAVLAAAGQRRGYFWVHDFASVCANYALMRNDVTFCGAPPPESAACQVCVYGERRWVQLGEHIRLFRALDLAIVAPSQAALDLWRTSFPAAPTDGGLVHPHAVLEPREAVDPGPIAARGRLETPLRVAFLGMPAPHKGWPVYSELVERFGADERYEFHHLAHKPDLRVDARFTSLANFSGPQPMIDAIGALAIDVALIWSLCPETFCFTAYEAAAAGAQILTNPDAGNVPLFVREGGHGWVLEDESALFDVFAGGDTLRLRRSERTVRLYDLAYSRMTADLIERTAP